MKSGPDCTRAEILGGAIALGEASDSQRNEYREHLSVCRRCLAAIGGEHEIERITGLVTRARDQERWEPDLRASLARPTRRHAGWVWAATLTIALVFVVGSISNRHSVGVATNAAVPVRAQLATRPDDRAIAALGTQAQQHRGDRAESLAFTSGAGARRTVTFQVRLDAQGKPVHCTVVKGSINLELGASLCDAVMRAH
jgi:hypothetical protein